MKKRSAKISAVVAIAAQCVKRDPEQLAGEVRAVEVQEAGGMPAPLRRWIETQIEICERGMRGAQAS